MEKHKAVRLAVISDIHGNLEALESVLKDLDGLNIDRVLCLGDVVGYGPNPEECVQLICSRNIPTIAGNHDKAILFPALLNWFNPTAQTSLIRTRAMLSAASRNWMAGLPFCAAMGSYYGVHGFPPKSFITYLFQVTAGRLQRAFARLSAPVCFVGHTHDLEIVTCNLQDIPMRRVLPVGLTVLQADCRYIINVGSVGQPRDGAPGAKYAVWNQTEHTLEVRRVMFDVEVVVAKMRRAGLPDAHAQRLRV